MGPPGGQILIQPDSFYLSGWMGGRHQWLSALTQTGSLIPTPQNIILTDISVSSRDWHFGFETSRFRNFCQFFEGFGIGFGKFGIGKKVSVSFSENLVSEKKVSVSVSENLVSEKKYRYRFRKIWYRKKSLGIGIGQTFGIVIQWQGGHLWDPMRPSGWFDESSDDSWGI